MPPVSAAGGAAGADMASVCTDGSFCTVADRSMLTVADAVGASSVAVDVSSVVGAVGVSSVACAGGSSVARMGGSSVGCACGSSVARAGRSSAPFTVWRPAVGSAVVTWAC